MELGFLGSLGELPIDTITRFGYDVDNARCYFSIGMLKKDGGGKLDVGIGNMDKFSGLVVSNMIVERNAQKHLVFPDGKAQMRVHRKTSGRSKQRRQVWRRIKESSISGLRRCATSTWLRGRTAGGGVGRPVSAAGYCNNPKPDSGGFKHVGDVQILYSHPERYFSFNMTLNEIDMIYAKLSGSLGFEFSPKLFGVYVGYPERFVEISTSSE